MSLIECPFYIYTNYLFPGRFIYFFLLFLALLMNKLYQLIVITNVNNYTFDNVDFFSFQV